MGTFNFSDTLARYGPELELTDKDLSEAYKRAGSAFKGQLQQNFFVLTEFGLNNAMDMARAGPFGGDGRMRGKRLRDEGKPEAQLGTPKKLAKQIRGGERVFSALSSFFPERVMNLTYLTYFV
jgi:hypothetical protein